MKQIFILCFIIFLNNTQNAQTTELITGLDCDCGLAFKGDELYFTEYGSGKISKINVMQIDPTPITVITGLDGPLALAFNGNELYIAESSGDKISKIDITDTTPILTTVISGLDWPVSIAIKGNELFISEFLGKISKINISQILPTQTTLLNLGWVNKLVINENDLYVAESYSNQISKTDIADTTPNTESIAYINFSRGITFDNDYLFVSHYYENIVSKINLLNDETTTLATGLNNPSDLEIKDNILYIVEVNKITKLDLSTLSVDHNNPRNMFKLFPNPSNDIIQVSNLTEATGYKIYNLLGEQVLNGAISNDEFINIKNLSKGLYILNLDDGCTLKFIKN